MHSTRIITIAALVAMLAGCGPRFDIGPEVDGYTVVGPNRKVTVDAYLFDAKVRRDGKPTSVRLQFFETDDAVAMSGQGYLGKGALKGRLTDDSLVAYFPATNEFVSESMPGLFASTACANQIPPPPLRTLLATLPTPDLFPSAVLTVTGEEEKELEYDIEWSDCPWRFKLSYDLRDEGWRLNELRFEVDAEVRFSMKRRVFKPDTEVKRSKLVFQVPERAVRVSL